MTQSTTADLNGFDDFHSLMDQAVACMMAVQTADDHEAAMSKDSMVSLMIAVAGHAGPVNESGPDTRCAGGIQHVMSSITALIWTVERFAGGPGCSDTLSFAALSLLKLSRLMLQQKLAAAVAAEAPEPLTATEAQAAAKPARARATEAA